MPIQRESDNETDDNESIGELPVVLPKYQVSQAKLDHLARARQRKAELASQRAEERAKEREEALALSRGVKKVKDPVAKEVIKKEILKATTLRQPKTALSNPNNSEHAPVPEPQTPIQKARKQPKIVVEDSEPEVIYVKVPKKKIVVQQSETESEAEPKPKTRRTRKPKPVETESSEYESEYDAPPPKPKLQRYPLKPPTAFPGFQINF